MKLNGRTKRVRIGSAAIMASCGLGLLGFGGVARADVYHAVEPGETLGSIAARYRTSADAIRAFNKLGEVGDNAPLASMLLCIPDKNSPSGSSGSSGAASSGASSGAAKPTKVLSSPTGSITKSVRYVVQAGDTVESIAAQYAQRGYPVTAEAIRLKNELNGQPSPNSALIIPLGGISYGEAMYRAVSSTAPRAASSVTATSPQVQVSEEMEWPVAKVVTSQQQPVYQAPNSAANRSKTTANRQAATRGPSNLSARGYFPSPDLGGVRVLGQNEEANNAATSRVPRPRVMTTQPAPRPATALAKVAQVARSGARIRRLPDAEAVTLYNCPVNTELAVTKQSGPWSAILMSDRSTGWIPTRYLRFTGANVDISTQVVMATQSAPTRSYNGRYNSHNPMVAHALTWLGTPYRYGGTSRYGIDCSALVQRSFSANGYRLPRTAAEQSKVGRAVDPSQLQPGDRLYFSASGSRVDHTGLYMGDGLFVHASGSGRQVMVSNLFDRRNWNIFVGARR